MFKHVNNDEDKNNIKQKFREALVMLNNPDEEIFFNTIDFSGYHTCSLFKTSFSASDCCNTVEILEKLFQLPHTDKYTKVSDSTELRNIFNSEGNTFYNFKVMPKGLPFHTFVIIKYKNNWFMLQSFFGICGLHVNEDVNIPKILLEYLDDPTSTRFNQLFGTDFTDIIANPNMMVTQYRFDKLPTEYLKQLLNNFIQK